MDSEHMLRSLGARCKTLAPPPGKFVALARRERPPAPSDGVQKRCVARRKMTAAPLTSRPMTRSASTAASLDNDLARELRQQIARGELELPVLSHTATQVASMCMNGTSDARSLASTLNHDPALAGHVLRVANSAKYAPVEPIVSLQQAVSRMGLTTVGQIAFAVAVGSRVFHAPGHDDWVREMWRHAALTAAWAREIARAKRANVESAFVSGLLHDVGEPVLLQAAIDLLSKSKATATREQLAPLLHELHVEAGAKLARTWKMAPAIVDAVGRHHSQSAEGCSQDAAIVQLADELALCLDSGPLEQFPARAQERFAGHAALDQLNLYEDEFAALLTRASAVNDFAGAMQ